MNEIKLMTFDLFSNFFKDSFFKSDKDYLDNDYGMNVNFLVM